MMIWIEKQLVLAIHDRQVAEHGGSQGLRDDGLLESALARPQQLYAYGDPAPDLADLAASLAFGLARNHPFIDGNKRTAAVCCETFIELNGGHLEADDPDLFVQYLALAEGKLPEEEFAAWLRPRLQTKPAGGVHERRRRYATAKPGTAASQRKAKPKARKKA
jgi:death-on-curing protein